MDIEGPLKIGVLDDPNRSGWELHLDFRDEFRDLELVDQGQQFADYLASLNKAIADCEATHPDYPGLLIVQQICEQLHPHISAGEIPLSETLVVEIAQNQGVSIHDLLAGNG